MIMMNALHIVVTIVFSFTLCLIYFIKKHIKTGETQIFSILLVSNLVGLVLELLSFYFSTYYGNLPTTFFVIKLYLGYLMFFLLYMTLYIYTICYVTCENPRIDHYKFLRLISFIIFFVCLFAMACMPISSSYGYATGPAVNFIYICSGAVMFEWLIPFFLNRKTIISKKILPLIIFMIFMGFFALIQKSNPEITIATILEFLVIFIMYHTIENPDVKMLEQTEMARNEAEKANRAKSDFLSSMSHEIRTPLNAIVGLSEDIGDFKDQVPPQVAEDASDIIAASQTLLEIVGNILDINKIESAKMEIVDVPYNPVQMITELARIDSTRIGDKPIDFKLRLAEDIPYELIGDKIHVKEVINNLITNAIKYTERGNVIVSVKCINKEDTSTLIISVQDTGRGIKKENIEKLFTKFERLDVEKNTTAEGTGLGLAITKKLVELMGGNINVQSQYGQGSLFVATIPQKISKMSAPLEVEKVLEKEEANADENVYGNKHILIVDDNKLNIKVAKRALASFNFEMDEALDGEQCLELINSGKSYDLILMDIMMPNMNGETTLKELKNNPNFNTPVIALTADAVTGAKEKYLEEGFVDYIAKPFSRDQIKEKLDIVFKK